MQEDPAKYSPGKRSHVRCVLLARTVLPGAGGVFAVRLFKNSLWLFAIACTVALSLPGQETTGTITGVVSDPSGALVANAELTVTNAGTGATFKTVSNSSGNYVFRTLPAGSYRLTRDRSGL